ncbi:hypothetical protein ACU61A_42095 [Pseudonocardia sichuanensis]
MTTPATETYRADWVAWRAGWEAVNWLDDTPRRFDGTPGLWWQDGDQVA